MLAEYHYDQITTILKARGMGHYGEAHEGGRAFIGDGMEAKRTNDVPMAAMWTQRPGVNDGAARLQRGHPRIGIGRAPVRQEPRRGGIPHRRLRRLGLVARALKPTADKELAMGLNRFVIHTSVHQPLLDKGPGLSLGPFGQWFTRNETWAEPAKAWVDLSRPQLVHAAAGPIRRRHRVLLR